jgi:catechol 2,3-dioxygenase
MKSMGQGGVRPPIDPATTLGPVRLRVADLDGTAAFYQRAIGLAELERSADEVHLGTTLGPPLLQLVGDPGAPAPPARTTGLFHLALLLPERADLAQAVHRVVGAGWSFTGASDHLVSEALYLDDPEGNGIEIYRDRPRDAWPRTPAGELEMATLPIDLDGVLASLPAGTPDEGVPAGAVMGHVHLRVRDIAEAGAFYGDLLGFDPTVTAYPGALFVAAGGYHHHLGLNVWGSRGAPPPPTGALGLDRFQIDLPAPGEADAIAARLDGAGVAVTPGPDGLEVTDPSGIRVVLA